MTQFMVGRRNETARTRPDGGEYTEGFTNYQVAGAVLSHIIEQAQASPACIRAELVLEQLGEGWTLFDVHHWTNQRALELNLLNSNEPWDFIEFAGWFARYYPKGTREDPIIFRLNVDDPIADADAIVAAVREATA